MRGLQKGIVFLTAAAMIAALAGCGAGTKGAANTMALSEDAMLYSESAVEEAGVGADVAAPAAGVTENAQASEEVRADAPGQQSRKLIKTVDMNIETKEFDNVLHSLESETASLGGYIESMNTYNGSSYSSYRESRWSEITIRIPVGELETFLNTVSNISNVTRRSENVEDVTLAYVDLESRRDALRTEQTRLLELLEKAETIEDIIAIESRLSEVRYQLESMESQLRTYDNKIDYSTVHLKISEVAVFTPVKEETTWERIANGFKGSLENIGVGLKELFIEFVINLPYLFVVAAVVAVVTLVIVAAIKLSGRKKGRNRQKDVQNSEKEREKT